MAALTDEEKAEYEAERDLLAKAVKQNTGRDL